MLLKRYRLEKDYYYHNERTYEQKRRDEIESQSLARLGQPIPAGGAGAATGDAKSDSAAPSGGGATGLSFAAGSHAVTRTSTFTPITPGSGSDGKPKNWKRVLRAGEQKASDAAANAKFDERWKSKVPLGFVAAARFLRSDAPASIIQNPNFDIKSQWLRRLSTLNTPLAEKEMESLTNDEILLADHCVHLLTQRMTEQLFVSADDRDDE